jgi:DNA-binding NtrC family response regulator
MPIHVKGNVMQHRILIADDDNRCGEPLRQMLQADGTYQVDIVADGQAALDLLTRNSYSVFLTDLRMPGVEGMKLIEELRYRQLPVAIIVMTGFGSIDQAVKAMRLGAVDFLTKPVDIDHLRLVLTRVLRERGLQAEVAQLREQLRSQYEFQNVLSKSERMHAVFELIQNVAGTNSTVLIEGETGTGKELVGHAIHQASAGFRRGEFVAINCAAVPENLLESELFGHEKGAFTSAVAQRKGRFELADGGTLFLDEVGDIPPSMQVKLLRVLQERRFERVGGTTHIEVDVRVIAATNRNLGKLVRRGKFREDLYYRLNVVKIDLPPLRERTEDIPLLATHFAEKYCRPNEQPKPFSPAAMQKLLEHSWPGNIRELENTIERACVVARGPTIEPDDLPPEVLAGKPAPSPAHRIDLSRKLPDLLRESMAELEKQYIRKALKKTRGNVMRCARICGLSRRSVSAKLAEYGIKKDEFKMDDL